MLADLALDRKAKALRAFSIERFSAFAQRAGNS
jgi:hypothetical protein